MSGLGAGGLGDGTGGLGDGTGGIGTGLGTDGLGGNTDGSNVSSLRDDMSLEDLIRYTEKRYGDMLAKLKAQGDDRALARTEILRRETKKWVEKYNISFRTINI